VGVRVNTKTGRDGGWHSPSRPSSQDLPFSGRPKLRLVLRWARSRSSSHDSRIPRFMHLLAGARSRSSRIVRASSSRPSGRRRGRVDGGYTGWGVPATDPVIAFSGLPGGSYLGPPRSSYHTPFHSRRKRRVRVYVAVPPHHCRSRGHAHAESRALSTEDRQERFRLLSVGDGGRTGGTRRRS
jgi:hypothetical protein